MSALDTFRRTMRRLERRARRIVPDSRVANGFWCARIEGWDDETGLRAWARDRRARGGAANRRAAFLYERAADAVAKLCAAGGGS